MKKKKKITIFDVVNVILMLFIIFVTLYPLYYVVIASFSNPSLLSRASGFIWKPIKPYTLLAYEKLFANELILIGFKNTLIQLVLGLAVNLILTIIGAYFLSLKGLMLKEPITLMIIFTMYFGGGLVPGYLNLRDLGLLNSVWALILPGALSTMNLIIMKSSFQALPDSLIESAKLDGAKHVQMIFLIMVPLCKATIAVLFLYYGVSHWNSWFPASIYIRDRELYPLQLVAQNILIQTQVGSMSEGIAASDMAQFAELIKYALIVVSTVPILILYPFLQKYFVKGVMVGSIKG